MAKTDSPFSKTGQEVPDDDPDEDVAWIDVSDADVTVEGTILDINTDAGEYGSTVYKLDPTGHTLDYVDTDSLDFDGEPDAVLFWGKSNIDRKVARADLEPGDWLGVHNTGQTERYTPEDSDEPQEYTVYVVQYDRQN